jgi:uncharacterized membrane protein YhaH (DUF805 family)
MTFIESIQTCFKKYAVFDGRAKKSEFWWWVLFVILLSAAGQILGESVYALVVLVTLLPYLAVTSRRLHDINRSGWWQLIVLIPLIGWIVLIYWCVQDSTGPNNYG